MGEISKRVSRNQKKTAYFEMTVSNLTCHKLLHQLGDEVPVLDLRERKSSLIFLFNGASEPKLCLHTGTLYYVRSAVGRGKKRVRDFIVIVKKSPLMKIKFLFLSPAIGSALGR